MTFVPYVTTCYPQYTKLCRILDVVPITGRSLLIKQCQAQVDITHAYSSTLYKLMDAYPLIVTKARHGEYTTLKLWEVFSNLEISVTSPLSSAIVLDIIRSYPPSISDAILTKNKGWLTEIALVYKKANPVVDFSSFFDLFNAQPIHPDLPYNPKSSYYICKMFEAFRSKFQKPTLRRYYARATHKNMSRSTRRHYEDFMQENLEDVPIFGQDDWQRVYHTHGIMLEGEVEMRQKWYPSGAKPRTYFAMGGTSYRYSRFLQDFFTELVNHFPSTNHISRLQPSRLELHPDPSYDDHYLIYDLSSFTSNMQEQQSFLLSFTEFMRGTFIEIVDERHGLEVVDLGDLLDDYIEFCVIFPQLSLERSPGSLGFSDITEVEHMRASMLGIFGNLMTCTLSHYLIVSPCVDSHTEDNTAGDDGAIHRTVENALDIDVAIGLVGDCAPDKTMMSNEEGAVCLKRPLYELRPHLLLGYNLVPPNLATSISYIQGEVVDPRYVMYGLDELPLSYRLSIVGKDLSRFIRASWLWGLDAENGVSAVYEGFTALVEKMIHVRIPSGGGLVRGSFVIWPVDPASYSFRESDPFRVMCIFNCSSREFPMLREDPVDTDSLRYAGDERVGNSDKRLGLLEKLGYLNRVDLVETFEEYAGMERLYAILTRAKLPPPVYHYTVVKDIPDCFMFDS